MKNYIKKTLSVYFGTFALMAVIIISCDNVDYSFENRVDPIEQLTINDISPVIGDIGTSVTVNGINFSATPSNNKVTVSGVTAEVTEASPTSLTFEVPEGATSGTIAISHGPFTADGPAFTIVDIPTISDVGPSNAIERDTLTITGTKFSTTLIENFLTINGVDAIVDEATETEIKTTVPVGSEAGLGDITITVGEQSDTFSGFAIEPSIVEITPVFGQEGDEVIITGTSFSATPEENMVNFNGAAAVVTAATATSITTTVPEGATTGPVSITVNNQSAAGPEFTLGDPPTLLVIALDSDSDDAEEVAEVDTAPDPLEPAPIVGDMDIESSDLEFGEISSDQGLQNIGLRFNNVVIPQGATVEGATIQFKCDDNGSDPVEVTIYGEAVDNAETFTLDSGNISARPLTTASMVWNIEPWLAAGDRTDAQKTVDLSVVIQEIVNRPGWVSGNSIGIIMKHTGVSVGATSSSTGREAENYSDSTPDDGAELTVSYSN